MVSGSTPVRALRADSVVVATGSYHVPRVPGLAACLPTDIHQLHSQAYRNEGSLPPGAVLVVGSGQTGIQLADELLAAGRRVYLAVGSNGWAPRRYRGRDIFGWLADTGDGRRETTACGCPGRTPCPIRAGVWRTPQLTGHHGGQDIDLRRMAAHGGAHAPATSSRSTDTG